MINLYPLSFQTTRDYNRIVLFQYITMTILTVLTSKALAQPSQPKPHTCLNSYGSNPYLAQTNSNTQCLHVPLCLKSKPMSKPKATPLPACTILPKNYTLVQTKSHTLAYMYLTPEIQALIKTEGHTLACIYRHAQNASPCPNQTLHPWLLLVPTHRKHLD